MAQVILEGFQKFHSKTKDSDYFVMVLTFPFSEGLVAVGRNCEKVFISESVFNMLDVSMIGKEVTCDYEFLGGGRPRIVGVSVAVNSKKGG